MPVIHRRRATVQQIKGVPVIRLLPRRLTAPFAFHYAQVSLKRALDYVEKRYPKGGRGLFV